MCQLYRLFLKAGYPLKIGQADRYLVATDEAEQIVGDAEAAKMLTRPYRKQWKVW